MIRLIYSVILLFILSGMYFVSRQSAEGLSMFLIQSIIIAVVGATIAMFLTKRKDSNFFGSALFIVLLLAGILQLLLI